MTILKEKKTYMKNSTFRWGWLVAVLGMTALACTCGALSQAQQAVATAEALATQGQGLATEAQQLATEFGDLATEIEESGFQETAEAMDTPSGDDGDLVFGDVPEDVPVHPENDTLFSLEGSVTYFSSASFDQMVDFYKQEMPNKGWAEASAAVEAGGSAVLYYEKDGRKATVTLSDLGAQTGVQILIEGN